MTEAARRVRSLSATRADDSSASEGLQSLDRLVALYGPDALLAGTPSADAAESLAAVVRILCADARRANPGRAEPMVMALHTALPRLPAVRRLMPSERAARLLAHIVRLAIAEFYDDGRGDMSDADKTRARDLESRAAPGGDAGEARP
jgi:hypothetical protein